MGEEGSWRWGQSSVGLEGSDEDEEEFLKAASMAAASRSPSQFSRRLSLPNSDFLLKQRMQDKLLASKMGQLQNQAMALQEEVLELRQETSDLQEYSNAKIGRVTRYLGVLAEKAHKLDELALESEARLASLRKERKKLLNEILSAKGNVRVFCRVRPQFEHEAHSVIELPDDFVVQVKAYGVDLESLNAPKKEFEFDKVYGPHVGQGDLFQDIQPLVQSALDGYNVSIFSYGQTGSGKTFTMEGPINDRGIFFRSFEELFDLSNLDTAPTSRFSFHLTMFEIYNEQVRDLLWNSPSNDGTMHIGSSGQGLDISLERIDNPTDFGRIYKMGMQNLVLDSIRAQGRKYAHLVLTIHIHFNNNLTGENQYSKLSMVDMVGSDKLSIEDTSGDDLTEILHAKKSLSALGDVLSALTAKKDNVPYANSSLTHILADSLGGESKTLVIVNISPNLGDVQETLTSLNFSTRARNLELSLGNCDTIKKWRDMANNAGKELYEKEKQVSELQQEILSMKKSLKEADDQCLLLFNEVQKAWKVAFTLQADLKTQTTTLVEKRNMDRDQNLQLRTQVEQLCKLDNEQKALLQERFLKMKELEGKVKILESQLAEVMAKEREAAVITNSLKHSAKVDEEPQITKEESEVTRKLEEELTKRDELIERLHEENEKLFERLQNTSLASPRVPRMESKAAVDDFQLNASLRNGPAKPPASLDGRSLSSANINPVVSVAPLTTPGGMVLTKSDSEKMKTTPAGEYLTSMLNDFNPDHLETPASVADGANKLLMLVLAAVIKAGAAREHEMLAEIRGAVFSFLRKMESRRVMDTMLVARVRILYIRSLLSRSPELQSIKVPPVDRFLEKGGHGGSGHSRGSSRGTSPARQPVQNDLFNEHIQPFKVYIRPDKKSKLSTIVLKLRGIDHETWRQHVTGGKLRETTEEARNYAIGNKQLAAIFVHTPAGELQRQIRTWLAENFDFLSLVGTDTVGGTGGQLELLSTAVMDGWMAGLGIPQSPSTDALGQLISNYTKQVYTSQLQHLKDVAATLATEEADDLAQITKLRSALESVEHKRRKVLQQMRSDVALLTKEEGGSPIRNPSTASEDARVASLMSLEDIVVQAEEIKKEASLRGLTSTRKATILATLNSLSERMPSLLSIDHPCAQKHILEAQKIAESCEQSSGPHHNQKSRSGVEPNSSVSERGGNVEIEVTQWCVLQFNNGSSAPFVMKCGANSSCELVVKAPPKIQDKSGKEIVAVVPPPTDLAGLSLEDMKRLLSKLPEAFGQLVLARSADGTRARYARLYKALALRVPSLKQLVTEMEWENSTEFSSASLSFKK